MAWRGLCLLAFVAGFAPPSPQRSAPCRPRRPPTRLHVEATVEEPVEDEETPEEDEEIWLNPAAAQHPTRTLGEALMLGDVVLCVRDVADADELEALRADGVAAMERQGAKPNGKNRFSVSDALAFEYDVVERCEALLLGVLDILDDDYPEIYDALFKPGDGWSARQPKSRLFSEGSEPDEFLGETCASLRDLYMMGELEWSEGEPAINVYTEGGGFGHHKDHMALSVLIPLSDPDDFAGGGTGYWSAAACPPSWPDGAPPETEPDAVVRPPLGTAIVFGGDVTHAGLPIDLGLRSVFVASLSTRTPASPPDRVSGLQQSQGSGSLREARY